MPSIPAFASRYDTGIVGHGPPVSMAQSLSRPEASRTNTTVTPCATCEARSRRDAQKPRCLSQLPSTPDTRQTQTHSRVATARGSAAVLCLYTRMCLSLCG